MEPSNSSKVTILIGGTPYSIDPLKVPYFQSYIDFQTKTGQELVHSSIPHFDAALAGVEKGYRHCFRNMPVELSAYHQLCETLELLLIDVLAGQSLGGIIAKLKEGKGDYEIEYKRAIFIKGDKTSARNAAFQFLYTIMHSERFEDENKDSMKIFNAVKYIVSHRAVFKYKARKIVRAAYEERFCATTKQVAELDKWPIIEPQGDGEEEEDVTTDEPSLDFDSSDYEFGGYDS